MRSDELRQVELFRDLDEPSLEQLAQEVVEIQVPEEYPVFQEGKPVDAFYVVREGRVAIYRDAVGKPVQLLDRVGPGEYCGELSLFSDSASSISARTTEPSRLLKFERQVFLAFLDGQPDVALKLRMAAAKRHSTNAAAALELGDRSEVRIRIKRRVELALPDGTSSTAVLDNLSQGGLSLQGAPPSWQVDDHVTFDLKFGDGVLGCRGRVAWVRGDLLGVAFTVKSDDHDDMIHGSMRRLLKTARAKT